MEEWKEEGEVFGVAVDVLDENFLKEVDENLKRRWGTSDVLISAAGGRRPGAVIQPEGSFFDASVPDLRDVFDLNLMGTLLPTYILGDLFLENGKSSIINYSSMVADRVIF